MILICYDGSDDAKAAVRHAGQLMPGHPATVLTVWKPYPPMVAYAAAGHGPLGGFDDTTAVDHASESFARQCAEEGSALAHEFSIDAQSHGVSRDASIVEAILDEADRVHADAIVLGSRGHGPISSALLGSVSHAVMQHADRPVLVVPSERVARRRHEHRCGPQSAERSAAT